METKYYTMTEKDALRKRFLYIPKEFKKYLKSDVFWIYKIINLEDDRVHIGKTSNMERRALEYVNEYLKGETSREICKAFQEIEFQYFIMMSLEITFTGRSAEFKEHYYIDLYDSIENGFNTTVCSAPTKAKRVRPGVPQTLYSKMIKSKLVACINTETKCIVFSTGLKLFGDYIHRSKDEVKSAARRQTRLGGYFIYYMNSTDFEKQVMDSESRIAKNGRYGDNKLQYHDFIKYSRYLCDYLRKSENPQKFEVKFITQSNDPCGYKFDSIEKFIRYYNDASNRIILSN